MANTSLVRVVSTAICLCLGFTGSSIAVADELQLGLRDKWVEDPYQAHDTTGATFRLGSVVGILALDEREFTGLGGSVAAGHRWGRLAIDAEYGYLEITERGPSSLRYGEAHELGVNVRFDVVRLGSRVVGPNSMAGMYVEGRVARQMRSPDRIPQNDDRATAMPGGSSSQVAAGFGVMFDHRLEQPRGFPNRVGWQLGWRVIGAPQPGPESYTTCRGSECVAAPSPDMPLRLGETSLVLSSSIGFTW
jgi:hypothetical protein